MGETTGGALRRGSDRIIGGVWAGLAAYFGVDPLLVGMVFVILALRDRPGGLRAGIILIALGAYLLIDNLGLLRGIRWDIVGPVVLIAVGLLVLARRH